MSIGDEAACRYIVCVCVCVYCVPNREVGRLCKVCLPPCQEHNIHTQIRHATTSSMDIITTF